MNTTEPGAPLPGDVGIGLIGAGWMGSLHTTAYRRVRDHYPKCPAAPRFVVVADEEQARAEAAARRLGYGRATAAIEDVIGDPEVDAISITAPNHVHRPAALAAADAGKPFWAEKPLGRSPDETAEIARAAEAAGIRTVVGFNYRFAPAVEHARALIADGALGEITNYRGEFLVDYASDPHTALSWRFSREQAGLGVLGDIMSHVVDTAIHLVGPIDSVTAEQLVLIEERPRPQRDSEAQFSVVPSDNVGLVENEDYVASLVRFRNGARGIFEVSRVIVGPHVEMRFQVHGTRGALGWSFQRMGELELYLPRDQRGTTGDVGYTRVFAGPGDGDFGRFQPTRGMPMGYDDLKVIEAHRFLSAVTGAPDPVPDVYDALAAAEVLAAIQASAQSGRWQDVCALRPSCVPGHDQPRLDSYARHRGT